MPLCSAVQLPRCQSDRIDQSIKYSLLRLKNDHKAAAGLLQATKLQAVLTSLQQPHHLQSCQGSCD